MDNERRKVIKERLDEFKKAFGQDDKKIFAELCFCVLTPQSKAEKAMEAMCELEQSGILFNGTEEQITSLLKGVRFPRNKARYIVENRKFFTEENKLKIKEKIEQFDDVFKLREWLVKNVKGLGMKEASHFLRNIGMSEDLAILDRHILKNLRNLNVINEIPKTLTKKRYLEIEEKMRRFSKSLGISIAELDLILWSKETGKVLK
ncbi:MAG: N-glycosylase/DNA lyase [Candidatus Nanoarchaeia archaeon]